MQINHPYSLGLSHAQYFVLVNSTCGSKSTTCPACAQARRDARTVVLNGLLVVRIRYGIPHSELPDLEAADLGRFLSFLLLQGKIRDPVAFPRRQSRVRDLDGLCLLQRLCRRDRWALAHSLNSIKRALPLDRCPRHKSTLHEEWFSHALQPDPSPPSRAYHRFVRNKVLEIFPHGWDRQYVDLVYRHVPRASARKDLFTRGDLLWQHEQEDFRRCCLQGRSSSTEGPGDVLPSLQTRYKEVFTTGKVRPLLMYDRFTDVLAPLHKCMYKHLSRTTDWLLVGSPTPEKISSVCVNEHQTSVDLVSATDNLSLSVTEVILGALFSTSLLPPRLQEFALRSLYPDVFFRGKNQGPVLHGQMMGGYLSFPLLCIHSYCAASWAVRDQPGARFLVNGDDTVISSRHEVPVDRYPPGVKLNDKKTIRARNVVEVNSTVFLKEGNRWRIVRHLRRGGGLSNFAGIVHMAKAVSFDRQWVSAFVRSRIGKSWGFMPSQLDLLRQGSRVAWRRELTLSRFRIPTPLPVPRVEKDEEIVLRPGKADFDEVLALNEHLFNEGRKVTCGFRFSPSMGRVRKTYRYRKREPFKMCSYQGAVLARKVEIRGSGRDETYSVPAEYVPIKERKDRIKWAVEE